MRSDGREFEITATVRSTVVPEVILEALDYSYPALLSMAKAAIHVAKMCVSEWDGSGVGAEVLREAIRKPSLILPASGIFAWDFNTAEMSAAPFYHAIEARACPQLRSLVARVYVYGMLRARFLLSERYGGAPHSCFAVIREPLRGRERRIQSPCPHSFSGLWARQRDSAFPTDQCLTYFNQHRRSISPASFIEGWPCDRRYAPTSVKERQSVVYPTVPVASRRPI